MIKNLSTIICQQAIVDKQTNLVSYINCIESAQITGKKLVFPEILLATLWENENEKELVVDYFIEITDSYGEIVKEHSKKGIKINSIFHRIHTNIKPFEIENAGVFKIQSKVKENDEWKLGSKVSFIVLDKTENEKSGNT